MCLHFYLVLFEQVGYSIFLVQYRKVFSEDFIVSRTVFGRFSLGQRRIGISINFLFRGISEFLYEFRTVVIIIFL